MKMQVDQILKLSLHRGSVYALAHGRNFSSFISAGSEGIIVECDIHRQSEAMAIAKVDGQVFSLLLIAERNHLLAGTMAGGLHIIDLGLKKEIHYITFHEQSIFDIKFWKGKLFVASKDGTLSVWSADTYALERVIKVSELSLRMISFNPAGNEAAIACSDNCCYLLDLDQWKVKAVLQGPGNSVFCCSYSVTGKELWAGSRDAQLYLYNIETRQLVKQVKAHLYTINDMQAIAENKYLATASRDKTIRIWDAATMELIRSLDNQKYEGHHHSVNKLLWLPADNYLVSASDDRSVIAWKIEIADSLDINTPHS